MKKKKNTATGGISVLVADDSKAFRTRLAHLISCIPGVERVVQADDGKAVLDALESARPAVAVVDMHLGDQPATLLLGRIRNTCPHIALLALTRLSAPSVLDTYRAAGADECFDKHTDMDDVMESIMRLVHVAQHPKKTPREVPS